MAKLQAQAIDTLANVSTAEDIKPTSANSHGAEITAEFDKHIVNFVSNFTDWAEIANQTPDQKHGTIMIAKTKYRINQVLQALWQGLYGNRTQEEVIKDSKQELDSVRYSDYSNMNYRSTLVSSLDLPEEGAQQQLSFEEANNVVRQVEGELRFTAFKSLFDAFKSLYELTCEDTWTYTPWEEKDKRKSDTASLAMALMQRRAKLPASE